MSTGILLGIGIDATSIHLIDYTPDPIGTNRLSLHLNTTDPTSLTPLHKEADVAEGFQKMENYEKLMEIAKDYKEIVLFGPPTSSRLEVLDLLKGDHRFLPIKITQIKTPNLTESQCHDFVRNFFTL